MKDWLRCPHPLRAAVLSPASGAVHGAQSGRRSRPGLSSGRTVPQTAIRQGSFSRPPPGPAAAVVCLGTDHLPRRSDVTLQGVITHLIELDANPSAAADIRRAKVGTRIFGYQGFLQPDGSRKPQSHVTVAVMVV